MIEIIIVNYILERKMVVIQHSALCDRNYDGESKCNNASPPTAIATAAAGPRYSADLGIPSVK